MREGWEYKKLGDACIVERGSSPRPIRDYITDSEDGVNWIKIGDTNKNEKYVTSTKQKITKKGAEKSRFVEVGDFILSNSMSFGRPYIMKVSGYIHDGWFVLRLPKDINSDYFWYLLSSPLLIEQFNLLAAGAIVKNISGDLVKKAELPIPPLPEQKQIVAILDKAFSAIHQAKANIEKNIQNAKDLLLSSKNKIFMSLENNMVQLPTICKEIFAGGDAPKNNMSKFKTSKYDIPIIANAVKDNGLYGYTDKARVIEPSITIAARGSGTGHTEIRKEPFLPIVRLIVLTPNLELISLEFLKYSIKNLTISKSGSAIPQLTIPMIKSYYLSIPSLEKQKTIVTKLSELDKKAENYNLINMNKISILEELKKSILQKAFAGELI